MQTTQNEVMKRLVNGTFTEEVLNNVLAVLEMKPVKEKTPAGFLTEKEACDFCGHLPEHALALEEERSQVLQSRRTLSLQPR